MALAQGNGAARGLLVALSSIAIVFGPGLGRSASLWTDGPLVAQPAVAAASPWVALARALKPAVVNVSTTHVDGNLRSEEHTSELQSQSNLVCRLLLEKKKKKVKDETSRYSRR